MVGVGLALILIGAAAVRLVGLRFGLPFPYANPDERIVTDHALQFTTGDWNPRYFAYPSLCFDLNALLALVVFAVGCLLDRWSSLAEFRTACWLDPGILLVAGRGLSLLFGVAAAWAAARAANELARALRPRDGTARGIAAVGAALAIGANALHVSTSRTITVDIPLVFFAALALAHLLRELRKGTGRDLLLAALFGGLATSSKYYAALLALPIGAVALAGAWSPAAITGVWWRPSAGHSRDVRRALQRLGLAAAAMVASFLVTSPYVLLDWRTFTREFALLQRHVEGGHYGHDPTRNAAWTYARLLAGPGFGVPLLLLAALGLVQALRSKGARLAAGVLLLHAGAHFALLTTFKAAPPDYLLPMLPALAVLAGLGVSEAGRLLALLGRSPRLRIAASLVVAASLLGGAWRGVKEGLLLQRPDTRVLLREWAEKGLPDGALVAGDAWLELPLTSACLEQMIAGRTSGNALAPRRGGDLTDEQLAAKFADARARPPPIAFDFVLLAPRELDLGLPLLELLRANHVRWLVLNGTHAARTGRMRAAFPKRAELYDRLLADDSAAALRLDPADGKASGPLLVVCDVEKALLSTSPAGGR